MRFVATPPPATLAERERQVLPDAHAQQVALWDVLGRLVDANASAPELQNIPAEIQDVLARRRRAV